MVPCEAHVIVARSGNASWKNLRKCQNPVKLFLPRRIREDSLRLKKRRDSATGSQASPEEEGSETIMRISLRENGIVHSFRKRKV